MPPDSPRTPSVSARVVDRVRRSAVEGLLAPAGAVYDLIAKPARRRAFGGPLNDQAFRRLIVEGVISACDLRTVIETGACRGTSTEFFAGSGVEAVFSIEYVPRLFWYTRLRLRKHPSVQILPGDSRDGLKRLASDRALTGKPTLFYLDAHWGPDLPLAGEIEIVAANWSQWVIIIDDFRVPDDAGYGYDSYGEDATIDAAYCARVGIDGMRLFYPALESRYETGFRRGCAVMTNVPEMIARLERLTALLRPAD
jgi:hypothetical protein